MFNPDPPQAAGTKPAALSFRLEGKSPQCDASKAADRACVFLRSVCFQEVDPPEEIDHRLHDFSDFIFFPILRCGRPLTTATSFVLKVQVSKVEQPAAADHRHWGFCL